MHKLVCHKCKIITVIKNIFTVIVGALARELKAQECSQYAGFCCLAQARLVIIYAVKCVLGVHLFKTNTTFQMQRNFTKEAVIHQ